MGKPRLCSGALVLRTMRRSFLYIDESVRTRCGHVSVQTSAFFSFIVQGAPNFPTSTTNY
eukprot:m.63439 g.63439  ORF g.63439 m.63439 type:complete len:60 (+) comp15835_c0_seq3:6525-6704(+)